MPDRVPTRLKVINGDKPDRINLDEPTARSTTRVPSAPGWFTVSQTALWRQVCRELIAMRLLYTADLDTVVSYVVATDLTNRIAAMLNDVNALTATSVTGVVHAHPYLASLDRAQGRAALLAVQLGLTPRARASLRMAATVPDTEANAESPASWFRGGA